MHAVYVQARVVGDKIQYQCKQRLNVFIRSCAHWSGTLYSALALTLALFLNSFSMLFGMLYSVATSELFSPCSTVLLPALQRTARFYCFMTAIKVAKEAAKRMATLHNGHNKEAWIAMATTCSMQRSSNNIADTFKCMWESPLPPEKANFLWRATLCDIQYILCFDYLVR